MQYGYDQVEDLIAVFQGTAKGGYNYARQGTPTTAALEAKITQMEGGTGSIVFSTGMAGAVRHVLHAAEGGRPPGGQQVRFGNTNSVFGTLADLGVQVTTVDATDAAQVQAAVRPNTRMVFVETIANPGTQVPDLEGIGALCRDKGLLLYVVDNTVASPYLFRPATVGAGLVMNSLTKALAARRCAGRRDPRHRAVRLGQLPQHFQGPTAGRPKAGACKQSAQRRACATWAAPGFTAAPPDCRGGRKPWPCAWNAPAPPRWHWRSGWNNTGRGQGALPTAAIAPAMRARPQTFQGTGSWFAVV